MEGYRLDKIADLWTRQMKRQIQLISLNWAEQIALDQVQMKDIFVKTVKAKAKEMKKWLITKLEKKRINHQKNRKAITPEEIMPWIIMVQATAAADITQ